MQENLTSEIAKASAVINESQTFLLTCHVHPDGDALGSTLGMAHALMGAGKQVFATFPDPFVIPENLEKSLPGIQILQERSDLLGIEQGFDVVMTFDCGSFSRLSGLESIIQSGGTFINIDHHISNERFADINIIDSSAASSGTVVMKVLDYCGIEINRDCAQSLYVALLTDTGRFQFSSTNEDVFEQAKRLSKYDLPIAQLSRWLTEEDSYNFLKLAGNALSEMELDSNSGLVSAVATKDMQDAFGVTYDQTDGLIEFVRRTKESDVACVVKEFEPGTYKVSLRSLGLIDVCEIAACFDGGGHKFAAGFTSSANPKSIIEEVKNQIMLQRSKS